MSFISKSLSSSHSYKNFLINMANHKIMERMSIIKNHVAFSMVRPEVGLKPTEVEQQALNGREFEIKCPWGFLRGKEWGTPSSETGIVALHGLLDNCGTYDRLAPLLPPQYHFVAYDFPGYGLSTPYPPGGYQTKENYLVDYNRILQRFGWKTTTVLGHSLGGAVAMFIGAANSGVTNRVILLDPAKPLSSVDKRAPDYLANFASVITQLEETPTKKKARTLDEAIRMTVEKSRNSLTEESAKILVKRGTTVVDSNKGLVVFNTDAKNILGLQPMFGEEGTLAYARFQGTNCDTLVITTPEWAIPDWAIGLDAVSREEYFTELAKYKRFVHLKVEGSHHVHLNQPERVAEYIIEFLQNSKIDLNKKRQQPLEIVHY